MVTMGSCEGWACSRGVPICRRARSIFLVHASLSISAIVSRSNSPVIYALAACIASISGPSTAPVRAPVCLPRMCVTHVHICTSLLCSIALAAKVCLISAHWLPLLVVLWSSSHVHALDRLGLPLLGGATSSRARAVPVTTHGSPVQASSTCRKGLGRIGPSMLLVIMGGLGRSQFRVVLLGRGLLLGVGSRAQLLGGR